jgi:hypothetical protein
MPTVTHAVANFLKARATPANADLVEKALSPGLEFQANMIPGIPVVGRRSTWTDGIITYWSIRCPKHSSSDPTWHDYEMTWPLDPYIEGIGFTGWQWTGRKSKFCGFDFDSIVGHENGISSEELEKVKEAACSLPYIQVRRSTGGSGLHLYCFLDDIPTRNHAEHARLARCVLDKMSKDTGYDFAPKLDTCGGVMWVWHRKMTADNHGLEVVAC